jgi:branched-subunit amino acid permease
VIIGSFDDARILEGAQTLDDVAADNAAAPQAWFVRGYLWLANRVTGIGRLIRPMARFFDRLSFEWREEMAVAESHPVLVAGFGLTTAALLAAPVVNLFFRPIIIVAAVHLLGQLAREEKAIVATSLVPMASAQAPGPTVPTEPATAAMRSS